MVASAASAPFPGRPSDSVPFGKASAIRSTADGGDLYLYDQIGGGGIFGGVGARDVAAALERARGKPELRVHISSPGGDFFEGLAIYNLLAAWPGKKTCIVEGLAASIASIIALACDHRITSPNAMWMIHRAQIYGASGDDRDFEKYCERLRTASDAMAQTYAKRTGQSLDQVNAWMAEEKWFSASEALAYGFSHETQSEGEQQAAQAALTIHVAALDRFEHTPEPLRLAAMAKLPEPPPALAGPTASPAGEKETSMDPKLIALLATQFGITAVTEAELVAALGRVAESQKKTQADMAAILVLSGKSSPAEAIGVLQAFKVEAEKVSALQAKVTELEAAAITRERDGLIEQGKKDGKLPPALEAWAKTQSIDSLKAFLAAATPVVVTAKTEMKAEEKAPEKPTPEQESIAKQLGVDPVKALAVK